LSDSNRLLATLVFVADTLCCKQNRGFNLTALRQKYEDGGILDVQMDPILIEQTAGKLDELVASATAVLA
jgi:hypothetical protein